MRALIKAMFMAALAAASNPLHADAIEHVEPPSWWLGMQHPELQLMIHGKGIAGYQPRIEDSSVRIAGTHRSDNPNYLFIDLAIAPEATAGEVTIEFDGGEAGTLTHRYPLQARRPGSAERRGFDASDVIYLLMPDRFANGDPGNDEVDGYEDGLSRSEEYGRHGGDLQGIIDHLDYIAEMGFTQIWLNPVVENEQPRWSYHGYAATDFYQVDPRLGDNNLYRRLSQEGRERGIGIIHDVVLNHIGSGHWWMADPPARDWINFDWQFAPTNHRRETIHDPHASKADLKAFHDGWFVAEMPDLNQRNPLLANYLIQNTIWWIEYADLSGLRVDTWPYSDKQFLSEWTARVMAEYPGMNIVGEEWTSNVALTAYWQRGKNRQDGYRSELPSLFDFKLQEAVQQALAEDEGWNTGLIRIWESIANDFQYPDPYNLVTMVDNHDMSRLLTVLGGDRDGLRMALGLYATTRGIPQIYYGTEIGMTHPGSESHGRIRDDFPGGWPGDPVNAFEGRGLSAADLALQDYTRALLNWRKGAAAVHKGKLTHFVPRDGVYVYFRYNDEQTLMIAVNSNREVAEVDTTRFAERIGDRRAAHDVLTGQRFTLPGLIGLPARRTTILELD